MLRLTFRNESPSNCGVCSRTKITPEKRGGSLDISTQCVPGDRGGVGKYLIWFSISDTHWLMAPFCSAMEVPQLNIFQRWELVKISDEMTHIFKEVNRMMKHESQFGNSRLFVTKERDIEWLESEAKWRCSGNFVNCKSCKIKSRRSGPLPVQLGNKVRTRAAKKPWAKFFQLRRRPSPG